MSEENQEAPTKVKQRLASKLGGKSKLGNKQSLKPSELKTKVKKTKTRVDQNLGEVACPELKLVSGSGKLKKIRPVTLRLDWPAPVAAAVFRRAGSLWMVFNKFTLFSSRKGGSPLLIFFIYMLLSTDTYIASSNIMSFTALLL